MFNWVKEDSEKIEKALENAEGFKFIRQPIHSGAVLGVGLTLQGKRKVYKTSEELEKAFNIKIYTVLIPPVDGKIISEKNFCKGVIIYDSFDEPLLMTDSSYEALSDQSRPCFIMHCLYRSEICRYKMVVFEDQHEADFYRLTKRVESLEAAVKTLEEYLSDPWKEYRAKEADFKQKLGKAEAATKYKIEKSKGDLATATEQLKETKEELVNMFKRGQG